MIALLLRTDGRDQLLAQTIDSINEKVTGPITRRIIHTDNGDNHRKKLADRYLNWEVIGGPRLGFGGAINRAWNYITDTGETEAFIFDVEDDFTFTRPIPLVDMMGIMMKNLHIAQMALRRQPWNEQEKAAGGIVECWPDCYTDCSDEGAHWLEHRLFWTTNPALYWRDRCKSGWPDIPRSEEFYSQLLFKNEDTVCAYWGSRDSGEWCFHNGRDRVGKGY